MSLLLLVWALAAAIPGTAREAGLRPRETPDPGQCRSIPENTARLRCHERVFPDPNQLSQASGGLVGGWRLVRTANPRGGKDAISIMRTADLLKSDADFAGLTLRCGDNGIEVLVISIRAFPPRARPQVTVSGGGASVQLTAAVAPPGTAVLLPPDAEALAAGPWQELKEVSLALEYEGAVTRGVVPLDGLRAALQSLWTMCASP